MSHTPSLIDASAALRRRVIDRPAMSRPCCVRLLSSTLRILLIIHVDKNTRSLRRRDGSGARWSLALRHRRGAGLWRSRFVLTAGTLPRSNMERVCRWFVPHCWRSLEDAGDGVTYDCRWSEMSLTTRSNAVSLNIVSSRTSLTVVSSKMWFMSVI